MKKITALNKIAAEISLCQECKKDKLGLPVPGEGNPDAKVVFVGEAPGKKEAQEGRPFIGASGKLLRKLIADAGLTDQDIFIASPVKYLPKHGTPKLDEILHGRQHLIKQLQVIKPKIVVVMGRVACIALLEKNCSIAADHGKIIKSDEFDYFLTYHPAAPLHNAKLRVVLADDFRKLKKLIRTL